MNTNKILLSALALSLVLTACKENENQEDIAAQNTYEQDAIDNDQDTDAVVVITKEEATARADEMRSNVAVNENNEVTIKNFEAYGQLQNDIKNLSVKPNTREVMNGKKAYESFEYFVEQMPTYLQTKLVMKEVDDVRKAMTRLNADLEDPSTNEATIKRHIMRVQESVADLNEEIVDVRLSLENDESIDFEAYENFVTNVNYDDTGYITIIDFDYYATVQDDWAALIKAPNDQKVRYEQTLQTSFNRMVDRMPAYLKIDDVMDAVADVRKEMKEYENEKNKASTDLEEQLENLEEIDEALYDLNKELIKSRKKYDDRKQDAIEEFMEEYNSNSNQTMQERINDAVEEYNEEMKK